MTLASLFSLAGPDMLIIFLIILVLFGAKRLPDLARGMGQSLREFQKAKDEALSPLTALRDGHDAETSAPKQENAETKSAV